MQVLEEGQVCTVQDITEFQSNGAMCSLKTMLDPEDKRDSGMGMLWKSIKNWLWKSISVGSEPAAH